MIQRDQLIRAVAIVLVVVSLAGVLPACGSGGAVAGAVIGAAVGGAIGSTYDDPYYADDYYYDEYYYYKAGPDGAAAW